MKTVSVTGYCPYVDDSISIKISYTEYKVLGSPPISAENILCPYSGECPDFEECPVVYQKEAL